MSSFASPEFIPVWILAATSIIAWLLTDARSKTRATFMEEKLNSLATEYTKNNAANDAAFAIIAVQNTTSVQDRLSIHNMLDRLDAQKASRDVVDGFRTEMTTMRNDMERRFDKLERMLEGRIFTRREAEDKEV